MTSTETLLFIWPGNDQPRLRYVGGRLVARGRAAEQMPDDAASIILVVPGEDVSIHWIDLPALAPAQARATARLMAVDLSASPISELHVAVGSPDGDGRVPMALISHARMTALLAEAADAGLDRAALVPEPLLLAQPDEGVVRLARSDHTLLRSAELAVSVDADTAHLLAPAPRDIDEGVFEAGLPGALALCSLDLRQGDYGVRPRWKADKDRFRRIGLWLTLAFVSLVGAQVVQGIRYHWGTAAIRADNIARAGAVLSGETTSDPASELDARLARLRGPGAGFERTAEALFAAISQTPNVELAALGFNDGAMQLSVNAATPGDVSALVARIELLGFTIASGRPQTGGGVSTHQLEMRPR